MSVTILALVVVVTFVADAASRDQFGWLSVPVLVGLFLFFFWEPARAVVRRIRPSRSDQ